MYFNTQVLGNVTLKCCQLSTFPWFSPGEVTMTYTLYSHFELVIAKLTIFSLLPWHLAKEIILYSELFFMYAKDFYVL